MILAGKAASLPRSKSILASSSKNLASIPISYVSRFDFGPFSGPKAEPPSSVRGTLYRLEPFGQAGLRDLVGREPGHTPIAKVPSRAARGSPPSGCRPAGGPPRDLCPGIDHIA